MAKEQRLSFPFVRSFFHLLPPSFFILPTLGFLPFISRLVPCVDGLLLAIAALALLELISCSLNSNQQKNRNVSKTQIHNPSVGQHISRFADIIDLFEEAGFVARS